MKMMKPLKISLLVVGVLIVGTLLTLRVTGLAPGHPSAEEYANAGRSARPGLWLTGEVVREARTQPSLRLVPGTVSPTPSRSYWFRVETNST